MWKFGKVVLAILGATALVAGLAAILFRHRIRFLLDYRMMETTVIAIHGENRLEPGAMPVIPAPLPVKTLPSPPTTDEYVSRQVGAHVVAFPERYCTEKCVQPYGLLLIENASVAISIIPGSGTYPFGPDRGGAPTLSESPGGKDILRFVESTPPLDALRRVYQSTHADIRAESDLARKYLALYLYGMKASLLPDVAEHAFQEFAAGSTRGFMSGDITKARVVVDLYCSDTGGFLTILFESKNGATMADIEAFIAALRVTKAPATDEDGEGAEGEE